MTPQDEIIIFGLSLSSSWGNGHATTFRALLRGLRAEGRRVLFLERRQPWYLENQDLPDPDFCKLEFYDDIDAVLDHHRDRLEQAYGDRHRFEIRSPSEGGFTVLIEIPYEPDADSDEPEVPVTSPAGLAALASAPTSPGSISPAAVPHPSGR